MEGKKGGGERKAHKGERCGVGYCYAKIIRIKIVRFA